MENGSETMVLTYSPYTYAMNKWDNNDEEARLCQAMVAYGDSAKEHWNDQQERGNTLMKEKFEYPEYELIEIDAEQDIICASQGEGGGDCIIVG